ncbi:MAG: DUF4139 domain-containing protein [Arenimonas sp.]
MTRTLIASALASAFAASASAPARADGNLTVYSGDFNAVSQSEGQPGGPGFALVERRIGFELQAGADNLVSLGGLPRALDAASVVLAPPAGVSVRGQRFDFALADQSELLRRALGQTVTVEQSVGNERQSLTGTLVAAGDGLTLRLPDGRIKVLSSYSSFELARMPAGVVNEPTLTWSLATQHGGRQDFGLSYATAGLAWQAEYRIDAHGLGNECRMSLDGAAMVVNRSGADFNDVHLTLVAGEPNRTQAAGMPAPRMMKAQAEMMVADNAVAASPSGEYQSYRLPLPGSLPQGAVQRLPLVDKAQGIACERRYETSWQQGEWRPPYPIVDENFAGGDGQAQPVIATLRFNNSKAAGLGLPLPAGRVRMFDGSDFLGEAQLGHTPANQDVALVIGTVFDLTAERTRADFQLDRAGRTMTERVTIKLKNAKAQPVTVRVSEQLARWTQWEITTSSLPFDKRNAQTASFEVAVPAEGETALSYTVRYRWAADVKIP